MPSELYGPVVFIVSNKNLIYQTFPTSRAEHVVGVLGARLGHVVRTGGVLRHYCHYDVSADSLPEPPRDVFYAAIWNESPNRGLFIDLQKGKQVLL